MNERALHIRNGRIPQEFATVDTAGTVEAGFVGSDVVVRDGLIASVAPNLAHDDAMVLDASDCFVLPGLVDVHVHGAVGVDTMDADVEGLYAMARFFGQHGVTGFLATTMTAPHADIVEAVRAVAKCDPLPASGARILGVHLEGPFISPAYPGAQSPASIREPNMAEFVELADAGPVRMITLAPETPGAHELIREAVARQISSVAGHTNATYEEFEAGVAAGITQATHTYNAMSPLHHRRPGTLGAVLTDDRVYAQLIADNIHVHPAAMDILKRCKSVERTVLITDGMRATGMQEGVYDLGGHQVTVRDGSCRLADGTLAGSILTLETSLANFMRATGLSIGEAWVAASRTPATSIGVADRLGSIVPGYWADLTILDRDLSVVATLVNGKVVYLRDASRMGQ